MRGLSGDVRETDLSNEIEMSLGVQVADIQQQATALIEHYPQRESPHHRQTCQDGHMDSYTTLCKRGSARILKEQHHSQWIRVILDSEYKRHQLRLGWDAGGYYGCDGKRISVVVTTRFDQTCFSLLKAFEWDIKAEEASDSMSWMTAREEIQGRSLGDAAFSIFSRRECASPYR